MGDWRTVNIVGSCGAEDVKTLHDILSVDFMDDNWNCLCNGGLCGLPNWAAEKISAIGNLGERDYTVEGVAETLTQIVAKVPTLNVKVHCGGEYESTDCVATIIVKDGDVKVGEPEIEQIMSVSEDQIFGRFMSGMGRSKI